MEDDSTDLIDAKEAAHMFKVSTDTIYKFAKCGLLPSVKLGAALRFDRWTMRQWVRDQEKRSEARNG